MAQEGGRRQTPREKKRLDLKKQRRGFSEYHHALRHGAWRKKRRGVNRAERSRVAALLGEARDDLEHGAIDPEEVDVGGVFRKRIEKWGATALGQWVKTQLDRRISRYAWNFFKDPYQSEQHREPFSKVLDALIKDSDGGDTQLGQRLQILLDAVDSPMAAAVEHNDRQVVRDARWLRAFFEDEPEWRARLRAWLRHDSVTS